MPEPLYAAIETGGTKIICAVGTSKAAIEQTILATRAPDAAMADIAAFLNAAQTRHGPVSATGIAAFGPLDLDRASPTYGGLMATPKPGWSGFDLLGSVGRMTGAPAAIDTDVNAAALAEARIGAARGCDPVAYVTVGTGIGVGLFVNGGTVHGPGHPEGGHIRPRRHALHDGFAGICPFHGDCLEGLASGPALAAHWGMPAKALPPQHPAWEAEADYLGQLCATLVLTIAPERIVIGGGVTDGAALLPAIRRRAAHWLGGYSPRLTEAEAFDRLIVSPGCTQPSGLAGAFLLAENAAHHG